MSSIKELEKEIKENLSQLDKDELKIIIRHIQSMINKQYMGEELEINKYEELCEELAGEDATSRYSHQDILSYIHNLKNIEESFYDNKK
tara:strand:- start:480 stop:746 length:267 start_codon:yes stop_codon:yes gene_type:complete